MFGSGHTYFADSPVVIDISGLEWSGSSPFNIVRVNVNYNGETIGDFHADTGGQSSISFDIQSALRAIWSDYVYSGEVEAANDAKDGKTTGLNSIILSGGGYTAKTDGIDFFGTNQGVRAFRSYSLEVLTEYLDSQDGEFTQTSSGTFTGGRCGIGGLTELERSLISNKVDADMSHWEHTNQRNGDASTKPTSSPERVGKTSITSWVDVSNAGTQSTFYSPTYNSGQGENNGTSAHAPQVLRDTTQEYVDFLFVNRRGAIETCSGLMKEAMNIDVSTTQYARVERPAFSPSRSLMAVGTDGRRSWSMSSGYVTREWAEWWTMEFLGGKRKQWWMKYKGPGMSAATFVPVVVKPAKSSTGIYDRSKQGMPHVDFTVTLALEG